VIGGIGLIPANRKRVQEQAGVGANTMVKTILTGAAITTTAYSGVLGATIFAAGPVAADSGTVPAGSTPDDVAATQVDEETASKLGCKVRRTCLIKMDRVRCGSVARAGADPHRTNSRVASAAETQTGDVR